MTPKEKAKELMQKAYDLDQYNKTTQSRCKQIALLCVDEIIESGTWGHIDWKYWQEVKKEIEKL